MMTGQPRWIPPEAMNTSAIKGEEGQGCPRCGGAVFAAEQMLAKGTSVSCLLSIPNDGRMLGPTAVSLAWQEDISCFRQMWHRKCFTCNDCRRPLDSISACDGPDREVYCKGCYGKKFGPKGFGYGTTLVSTDPEAQQPAPRDDKPSGGVAPPGEGCLRCGFSVFQAEMMISKDKVWHKRCFNCAECHKSLDSTNLCDGPDGEIYCKAHYHVRFGIKGIGFGMGAGCLSMG
ncbi:unnamed protein product [Cyprideis torosa]|uniref:Uncharacterized protein n=1 Tax=Cyprideis torosa TaxID=163714 RepID=A0A7R8ZM23_9CRUS|nr:unnamed protein product [Cyprideis torosa]CAG0894578.1 unnamed protein product [Cyprideis torosa]